MAPPPSRVRRALLLPFLGALVLSVAVLSGCRELTPRGHARDAPSGLELLIFVFDRSTSVLDHELLHARELTRARAGALEHGDRIVAIELLQHSIAEDPRRWSQQVPDRRFPDRQAPGDSLARARFVQDVRDYLTGFGRPEERDSIRGTDILSTLHLVAAEIRESPERQTTLVLYSDMLQANAEMNMEGLQRMPPSSWATDQAALGTLPDLGGLCVVVVGARTDTPAAQTVRGFWEEYFEATGAVLLPENYVYRPVRLPRRPCTGGA